MATMIDRVCKNRACCAKFMARTADVKRGWGLFCSKSCKASTPELGRGQRDYLKLARAVVAPVIVRPLHQESMYELGTQEFAPWDDRAWQAAG